MPKVFGQELDGIEPDRFTRVVERLLLHLEMRDVSNIDGSGDEGADIIAVSENGDRYVFQVKSKVRGSVDAQAVRELLNGMRRWKTTQGRVVTNRSLSREAVRSMEEYKRVLKQDLMAINGVDLLSLFDEANERIGRLELRPYQVDAFQAAKHDLGQNNRAFLVLATGLGKTVIAGEILDSFMSSGRANKVLVLADKKPLVDQLERALWRHLPKDVPTQQITGDEKPNDVDGVTVATVQSAITYLRDGYRPDLLFIDEAHHAGEDSQFLQAIELCGDIPRFGATATPFRGDSFDIRSVFGKPSFEMDITEGLRLGYLAEVDYRVFNDDIDWTAVTNRSQNQYTIKNLNKQLFLPQRDEQIRDELLNV